MRINKSTVYNWIKVLNKKTTGLKLKWKDESTQEFIEMDELYSYTTHKKI